MKRFLRPLALLFTHHPSRAWGFTSPFTLHPSRSLALITLHASLITGVLALSCGGDDKSDGDSSGSKALRDRVMEANLSFALKKCEVRFACPATSLLKIPEPFSSVEECKKGVADPEFRQSDEFLFERRPASCFDENFSSSYDACVDFVLAQDTKTLCGYADEFGVLINGLAGVNPQCATVRDRSASKPDCYNFGLILSPKR